MNKQEIIDAAMQIAVGVGGDPHGSPVIDGEMTAEDLLPLAFRHAYKAMLHSGELRLQDVIAAHTITLTANVGELPAGVLREHMDHSFIPADPYSSFLRYYADYARERFDNLLNYYAVNNGNLYYSGIDAPGNGNVILHAPSVPAIPADPDEDIEIPEAARDAVVNTLALAIRGELKLVQ
jgi:hypothetical protein